MLTVKFWQSKAGWVDLGPTSMLCFQVTYYSRCRLWFIALRLSNKFIDAEKSKVSDCVVTCNIQIYLGLLAETVAIIDQYVN